MNSAHRRLQFESLEKREALTAAPLADTVVHTYMGAPADGATPLGDPTLVGSTLYGTTSVGGANNLGTIFKLNRDGTGYALLHEFTGQLVDGSRPQHGAMTFDGTKLYGTTFAGGTSGLGVLFSYDTTQPAATAFSVTHSFTGGLFDGASPSGGLTLSGTTLYGVTTVGGLFNSGALFKIDTSGNPASYQVLAFFSGLNGQQPIGAPVLLNNHLYGMTTAGGGGALGTIYDFDLIASTLTTLRSFVGGATDGATPGNGKLATIGSQLYGTTSLGGVNNLGTLFRYDTTQPPATAFSILQSFAGGVTDGSNPLGSVSTVANTLFATTSEGGTTNKGTLFSFETTSATYKLLYSFTGSPSDGDTPVDGVMPLAEPGRITLFGMTSEGGVPAGSGTFYTLQIPVADPNALFATSADVNGKPQVTVYNAAGAVKFNFMPYAKTFLGGVRVALGDVNADGTPDIVTVAGPGKRQLVKVYSGTNLALLNAFYASNQYFSGGLYVSTGNFDANAQQEVIVGFGSGGTSAVQVFNCDATTNTLLLLLYPFGKGFKGGTQVAAANLDGIGTDELIVAPGYGGGSQVKTYQANGTLFSSFVAYDSKFNGGLFVAAGDVNGDGKAEIVTGPAVGNVSLVKVFTSTGALIAQRNLDGNNYRGGARVAVVDRNQDGIGEVVEVPGLLGSQNVRFLDGTTLATLDSIFAGYPAPRNGRGVFVAGSRPF